MSGAFLKSVLFGLLVAGSVGPIAILIISTAASRGVWHGIFAAFGAALADLAYALLAFWVGAWALPLLEAQARWIRIGSALVLIGFAIAMFRSAVRPGTTRPAVPRAALDTLLPTFLLTFFNPMTLAFFAGFVPQLPVAGAPALAAWFAFGLFLGSLGAQLALAVSGWLLGAALPGHGWQRSIGFLGAAGILAFGLAGLWSSVNPLGDEIMTLELKYLVYVTVLTGILWIPYVLNRLAVRGISDTMGYPENPKPLAKWAERLQAAHSNAVENLVVFATLVLVAHVLGVSNETTVFACCLYFWARLAHAIVYALGLPWLRTLTWTAGFVGQALLAWQLLA